MQVFTVAVDGVLKVLAEDTDDNNSVVEKLKSSLFRDFEVGGKVSFHVKDSESVGLRRIDGYQPIADGSGRVPPGEE